MPIRNIEAVNKTNQFIDLAGVDQVVRVKDNGQIATHSNIWNRIVSLFRGNNTQRANQRTAEVFKESLLEAAGEYDYKSGTEAYHPNDIFYQFVGLSAFRRRELITEVLNSGILNEELAGNRALTGRKIQEVISQVSNKGATHFAQEKERLFRQAEEGLGLYRESEAKFREGNFDRSKLEGINIFAYDETVARFQYVEDELKQLIINLQQDLDTSIEVNDIPTAQFLLDQIKQAGKYQSQIALFNAECKYNAQYRTRVENLEKAYAKASPHLEQVTLNFANLNEAQIQARDELIAISEEATQLASLVNRSTKNVKEHLDGAFLDNEEIAQWQEMNDRFERMQEAVAAIAANTSTVQIKMGHKSNHRNEPHLRSEDSHLNPSAIIKKAEIDTVEAKLVRMAEEAANTRPASTPKKSALKTRVAQESLDQIKQKKKVGFSSALEVGQAGGDEHTLEIRRGVERSQTINEDISSIDDADDVTGIYDQNTRTIRRDTFSNLGRNERISLTPEEKAAVTAAGLRTAAQEDSLNLFESRLAEAQKAAQPYLENSEDYNPLKLVVLANKRNTDLSKLTPDHKQYFADLLSLRLNDLATHHNGSRFTPDEIESVIGKALRYVCTLSPAEVTASQARLADLKNAGLTLLASASGQELRGINANPKNISIAFIEFLDETTTEAVAKDILLGGNSEYGGQDAILIQRTALSLAIHSLKPSDRQLVFSDIVANNSPYRSAFLIATTLGNHPGLVDPTGLGVNAGHISAVAELQGVFGNFVEILGASAGKPASEASDIESAFNRAADQIAYTDLQSGSVKPDILELTKLDSDQTAKDMFNILDTFIGVRAEQMRANQLEEEARFQRQIEADRAAQNNSAS